MARLVVRRGNPADAAAAGEICYQAFKSIAEAHNFPPDLPDPEHGIAVCAAFINHPGFFDVMAEIDGRIVGSNFLDERNPISGVGPITVDPALQNDGVGRALMQAALDRSSARGFPGIRLVQAGYHRRTLALYLKLGFEAREYLACLQGPAIGKAVPGHAVRPATADDLPACNGLCFSVHGHHRGGELGDAVAQGTARLVERVGRVTGYSTAIGYFGHAVAETDDDLKALIAAANPIEGPGVLVPVRNGAMIRWALAEGLRITQTATLMTIGLYTEPKGAWLPSITY